MPRISPTAEGFRAAWRRPSLTFVEIMWRWVVGATAAALGLFGVVEYLRTLPVSNTDLLLLKTRQPLLVGQAVAHILRGSGQRAIFAGLLSAIAVSALWILAASLGRIATVRALLNYFATRRSILDNDSPAIEDEAAPRLQRFPFSGLLNLNFLRVALAIAIAFGLVGATIVAGFASPHSTPNPGTFFLLFLPMATLVCLAGYLLNWFLSLGGLLAARDGSDALGALSSAMNLWRERPGAISAVTLWNGLAHLTVFMVASTVASVPLGFLPIVSGRAILAFTVFVFLAYFAIVDWLYIARAAGYLSILELPAEYAAPTSPAPVAPTPIETSIDRNEPILSDIPPLPATT